MAKMSGKTNPISLVFLNSSSLPNKRWDINWSKLPIMVCISAIPDIMYNFHGEACTSLLHRSKMTNEESNSVTVKKSW